MAFATCDVVVNGISYAEGRDDQSDPLMGHGRQEVTFYLGLHPLIGDANQAKGFNLGSLERVFAALASDCERFLLCVNHSQILSRPRLYRSEQEGVCDTDSCLLT